MSFQYLKPNFSNHPLNYLGVLFVFLFFFFSSLNAQAFEDDGSWVDGKFYAVLASVSDGYGPTVSAACSDASHSQALVVNDSGPEPMCGYYYLYDNRIELFQAVTLRQYNCGTSTSEPKVRGGCWTSPGPVNNCPDYGTVKFTLTPVNGEMHELEDGTKTFIRKDAEGNTVVELGGGGSFEGCAYARPVTPEGQAFLEGLPEQSYNCHGDGICFRREYMIATGEQVSEGTADSLRAYDTDKTDAINEGNKDTRKDTTETVIEDPVIVNNPDGSSSRTDKKTETTVKASGQVVTETTETVTITDSSGIAKTVTTTTNVVTLPDGSKTVTTDVNTAFSRGSTANYTIDKSTGNGTVSVTPGSSASSNTRTIETYDSEGNKTGSSSETTQQGEGEAKEDQAEDACKENPDECKEWEAEEGDGKFDIQSETDEKTIQLNKLQDQMTTIKDDLEQRFNFSGSAPSLGCYNFFQFEGQTYKVCLSDYSEAFSKIGSALMFLTLILSAYLVLGRSD